jgi:hypothetical protein
VADVLDRDALRALGVDECDCAVLALRGHIDTSVLAVLVLQDLAFAKSSPKPSAKITAAPPAPRGLARRVPEMDMAERAAQIITAPDLLDYVNLAPGYGLSEIEVPTPFIDKTIIQANVRRNMESNRRHSQPARCGGARHPDGTAKAAGALGKYGSSLPRTLPRQPHRVCLQRTPSSRTHGCLLSHRLIIHSARAICFCAWPHGRPPPLADVGAGRKKNFTTKKSKGTKEKKNKSRACFVRKRRQNKPGTEFSRFSFFSCFRG